MTVPLLGVAEQAWKIQEDCERAAIRDALVSTRWYHYNLILGLASAITAALAGFLAGNLGTKVAIPNWIDNSAVISFFGLASAVLASALTFLAPAEKANALQQTSNKYHALRERLRYFINNQCNDASPDPAKKLMDFILEKQEIDADHPILPEWAYKKAQERIKRKIRLKSDLDDERRKAALSAQA